MLDDIYAAPVYKPRVADPKNFKCHNQKSIQMYKPEAPVQIKLGLSGSDNGGIF